MRSGGTAPYVERRSVKEIPELKVRVRIALTAGEVPGDQTSAHPHARRYRLPNGQLAIQFQESRRHPHPLRGSRCCRCDQNALGRDELARGTESIKRILMAWNTPQSGSADWNPSTGDGRWGSRVVSAIGRWSRRWRGFTWGRATMRWEELTVTWDQLEA
jgi:hypothetical protein